MTKIPPFLRPAGVLEFRQPEVPSLIAIDFDQPPEKAIEFFKAKGLKPAFSYADVFLEEHDKAFTVAKMMDVDLLSDVREAMDTALAEGKTFKQFADEIKPKLIAKGWWGKKTVIDPATGIPTKAQLGSPARLRTIFRSNMASSMAVGHWQQAEANRDIMPYLRYDAIEDERTRDSHRVLDGIIRPVGDPWWDSYYPPNGYNCRCSAIPVSDEDMVANGWKLSGAGDVDFGTVPWTNPRTGKTHQIPAHITPGWNHNPGMAQVDALLSLHEEKILAMPWSDLRTAALRAKGIELPTISQRVASLKAAEAAISVAAANAAASQELDAIAAGTAPDPASWKAQSLKTLSKQPGWDNLTPGDQLAAVLAKAAEKKATHEVSAKLYQYKQAAIKGKTPSKAAAEAFKNASAVQQAKILAQIDDATGAAAKKAANEAAKKELEGIAAGTVKDPANWKKQSLTKLQKIPGFENGSPTEQLEAVLAHANDLKAKNVISGKLSAYKKAITNGKKPPPSSQAVFDALPDSDKSAFELKAVEQLAKKEGLSQQEISDLKKILGDDTKHPPGTKLQLGSKLVENLKTTPAPTPAPTPAASLTAQQIDDVLDNYPGLPKPLAASIKDTAEDLIKGGDPVDLDELNVLIDAALDNPEDFGIDPAILGALDNTDPVTAAIAPASRETLNVNRMNQVGPQKGSNPGGLFQDPSTGERWYVKLADSDDVARNEVLAGKIYSELGIEVPELRLVDIDLPSVGKGPGVASRYMDGVEKVGGPRLAAKKVTGSRENFAVDAWLANWDVAGTGYDNLLLNGSRAVRIDVGGSLRYRAQGGLKGGAFGKKVDEFETLLDPGKNTYSATVFKNMTKAELEAGVRKVLAVTDDDIERLVRRYGPTDAAIADELIDTLKARRDYMAAKFPNIAKPEPAIAKPKGGFLASGEADEIARARSNGWVRITDSGDIEDHHVLIYEVDTPAGKETRVWLKAHGDALEKLHQQATKGQVQAAPKVIVNSAPLDMKAKETIIGIASPKNPTVRMKDIQRVAELEDALKAFKADVAKAIKSGDLKKADTTTMLAYYDGFLDDAKKAIAGGEGSPMAWSGKHFTDVGLRVTEKPKPLPAAKAGEINWTVGQHEWKKSDFDRGYMKPNNATDGRIPWSEAAKARIDDADVTYFTGGNGGSGYGAEFALRGQIEIRIKGSAATASESIERTMKRLGLRTTRPTAVDREELYLIQIAAHTNDSAVLQSMDRLRYLPDQADRIAQMKAALKTHFGRDITKAADYRPDGRYQAFDSGRKLLYRPGMEDTAEWKRFAKGYRIIHENMNDSIVESMRNIIRSGGQMAPTTDKLRRGVPTGGMSPERDMTTGGASYFFTRIREATNTGVDEGWIWKPRQLLRLDAISYPGDKYGDVTGNMVRSYRGGSIDAWERYATNWRNETNFKGSLSIFDDLEAIKVRNDSQKKAMIQMLKSEGYPMHPDGRSWEQVVVTSYKPK